jgi:hypothetical protein
MSRLEVPLLGKKVWKTGEILLRAELDLLIRDHQAVLKPESFRVDSGTEMTTMPAALARALNLPMPKKPILLDVNGARREVRPGILRAQISGMDATEYVFPCYFLGNPDAPLVSNQPPRPGRSLLGLTGVVDKIRIAFDGTPSADAQYGIMIIEKR